MGIYSVKLCKLTDGERYPLLLRSIDNTPVFLPTVYISSMRRSKSVAALTLEADLRAILHLYSWSDFSHIDIDSRFEKLDYLTIEEIDDLYDKLHLKLKFLEGIINSRHKSEITFNEQYSSRMGEKEPPKNTVQKKTVVRKMLPIISYLKWLSTLPLRRLSELDETKYIVARAKRDDMLDALTARVPSDTRRNYIGQRTGLNAEDFTTFVNAIVYGSSENVFGNGNDAFRNFVIISLLLTTGIRRGELLGLSIDDIDFQHNSVLIHRRADDKNDPRKDQPNAKTLGRELGLENWVVQLIQTYIFEHRNKIKKTKKHPFLFVVHKRGPYEGRPLSNSGYNKIFVKINNAESGLSQRVTGHVLRHTWNDKFAKILQDKKTSEARSKQLHNNSSGWAPQSESRDLYTGEEVRKDSREATLKLQRNLKDSYEGSK